MVMLLLLLYLLQRYCSGSIGSDLTASSSTTIRPFLERMQFCSMYCESTTLRETFFTIWTGVGLLTGMCAYMFS